MTDTVKLDEEAELERLRRDLFGGDPEGEAWQYNKYEEGYSWGSCVKWVDDRQVWIKPDYSLPYRYRLHPHNTLMQAYSKGANIEQLSDSGNWFADKEPAWIPNNTQYRIAPDPPQQDTPQQSKCEPLEQSGYIIEKVHGIEAKLNLMINTIKKGLTDKHIVELDEELVDTLTDDKWFDALMVLRNQLKVQCTTEKQKANQAEGKKMLLELINTTME